MHEICLQSLRTGAWTQIKTMGKLILLLALFGLLEARTVKLDNDNGKIVGGEEVEPYSIPYQVSFQLGGVFHFCGGAVIRDDVVMTAAHCCDGFTPGEVQIVAGEHNIAIEEGFEQAREINRIVMHEDYSSTSGGNDICLLILSSPLDFSTGKVAAVPLPNQGDEYEADSPSVVSGWGTLESGGSSPDVLMKVEVPIVSDTICNIEYLFQIKDSMICAGEKGKDSCQGDSGGPLTCDGVHCGIVSWGIGCADRFHPGVYTQTSYFVDWINDSLPPRPSTL